ncbi:MAG: hypothetical protein RL380_532 [Verrucomicrobiota bacterium]|jgi:type II secretory pathway pseudopilin PulG
MKTKNVLPKNLRRALAFSLVEFIGVLTVIAILAAVSLSVVVKRVDLAAANTEVANLASISNALVLQILRSNSIPSDTTWHSNAASWLALPANSVLTNARGYTRKLLIDTNGFGSLTLPYTQTAAGLATLPTSPRFIVVSSLTANLPSGLATKPGATVFNDIWGTTPNKIPTNSVWTGWTGRGDDLVIQRMSLQPLFHRVLLVNADGGPQGKYGINGSTATAVPSGGTGTNAYFIDGSVLNLYDTNATAKLLASEILKMDISRVYDSSIWRDQLGVGATNTTPTDLAGLAAAYYTNAPPGGWGTNANKWGGTPQSVLGLMNGFMNGYMTWAANSPCFSFEGQGNVNAANFPPYDEMNNAINAFSKGGDTIP